MCSPSPNEKELKSDQILSKSLEQISFLPKHKVMLYKFQAYGDSNSMNTLKTQSLEPESTMVGSTGTDQVQFPALYGSPASPSAALMAP